MKKLLYQIAIETIEREQQPKVLKAFLDMQLFVIYDNDDIVLSTDTNSGPLDLPFKEIVFELVSENNYMENKLIGVVEKDFNDYTFYSYSLEDDKKHFNVNWINDDQPNNEKNKTEYNRVKEIVRLYCNKLNSFKSYESDIPNLMVRRKKEKSNKTKLVPINLGSVIHIANTVKTKKSVEQALGKSVTWAVSFRSRGHWRRVACVGKDRQGKRCIDGFTWVKESKLKGNGPLLDQVRVLKKQS